MIIQQNLSLNNNNNNATRQQYLPAVANEVKHVRSIYYLIPNHYTAISTEKTIFNYLQPTLKNITRVLIYKHNKQMHLLYITSNNTYFKIIIGSFNFTK